MTKRPSDDQRAVETFWQNNAGYCVSCLVSTLAGGIIGQGVKGDLAELCEKAAELCCPIDDYQEAAEQAGWSHKHPTIPNPENYIMHPDRYHDAGNVVAYETWEECCRDENIEPYQWEIFEHWIVDSWLAEKLEAKGERVDMDFEGLCVWGRTTTGQAVFLDRVICEIFDDLHKDD